MINCGYSGAYAMVIWTKREKKVSRTSSFFFFFYFRACYLGLYFLSYFYIVRR